MSIQTAKAVTALGMAVIVIMALASGCEPPEVKGANEFAARVKAVAKPDQVREWATNLIVKYGYSNGITGIPVKEADIPDWMRMVYGNEKTGRPDVSIQPARTDRGNEPWVSILYQPQEPLCELEVGSPTLPNVRPDPGTFRLQWQPGIYFWVTP